MDRLFNQEVGIFRVNTPTPQNNNSHTNPFAINNTNTVKDEYVATIKVRISRKGSSSPSTVKDVNSFSVGKMRLYADITEDIRIGDRVKDVSENLNYTVSYVYKPNSHHIEAELEIIRKEY